MSFKPFLKCHYRHCQYFNVFVLYSLGKKRKKKKKKKEQYADMVI